MPCLLCCAHYAGTVLFVSRSYGRSDILKSFVAQPVSRLSESFVYHDADAVEVLHFFRLIVVVRVAVIENSLQTAYFIPSVVCRYALFVVRRFVSYCFDFVLQTLHSVCKGALKEDVKDEAEEDGSCGNHKEEYLHLSLCLCDILFRQYSHNPEGWRSPVVADKHLCRNRGVFGLYLSYNCNGQRFRFAFSFGYRLNGKGKAQVSRNAVYQSWAELFCRKKITCLRPLFVGLQNGLYGKQQCFVSLKNYAACAVLVFIVKKLIVVWVAEYRRIFVLGRGRLVWAAVIFKERDFSSVVNKNKG